MRIFDATLSTLERALDVRLVRQNVLASDVANANTPNYVAKELDFEGAMRAAEAAGPSFTVPTRPGDISIAETVTPGSPDSFVKDDPAASPGLDGNAVDLDRTLGAIAENSLEYGVAAKAAAKKIAILRYVASDGAN